MTREEKQLLLKDLCARQFYGTKVLGPWEKDGPCELSAIDLTSSRQIRVFEDWFKVEEVKPYLRPMSSMTEEERKYFWDNGGALTFANVLDDTWEVDKLTVELLDWLNTRHFDYRGLIEKGLALEAKDGMYKNE